MSDFHLGVELDRRRQEAIPVAERCEWCDGTGNEFLRMYRRCPKCNGTGRVPTHSESTTEKS